MRRAILSAEDLQTEEVEVPEWDLILTIKGLSGAERDRYEQSLVKDGKRGAVKMNMQNMRARLVALTVVDGQNKRVFHDREIIDLGQKSAVALQRVVEVAQRLSGIGDNDLEELAENFEEGQSEDSTSG
ncbi:MAG: hypothetical protein DWQ07_12785 [Chloroflexi bacterium]|nr:MAG: hypothetical protein DWQ07_12785 [Chloroflexota bacterium]MBL1196915.1 hypothetical protein [Chloroflexota bacterium]NOH14211.1 hypothetical protein [Chloroflexota bacterium]